MSVLSSYTNEELIRYFRTTDNEQIRLLCERLEGRGDSLAEEVADLRSELRDAESRVDKFEGALYEIDNILAGDDPDADKLSDIRKALP